MNKFVLSIIVIFLFCIISVPSFAKDITLAWDANPESDVIGYKLYYKNGSSTLPFNGSDAAEGSSPIDVGNNLTQTLTGLADGGIYFFAVTAYNAEGLESPFSAVVASDWVPELFYPQTEETVSPDEVAFSWSEAPDGAEVTYALIYGTDPSLQGGSLASHTSQNSTMFAGAGFLGLLGASLVRRRHFPVLAVCLLGAFLLAGCGGGGGSDDPAPVINPGGSPPPGDSTSSPETSVITGITGNTQSVRDLQAETTYYWKVVATDAQGNQRESAIGSFTTGRF